MNTSSKKLIEYVGAVRLRDFPNAQLRQKVQAFCEKQEKEARRSPPFKPGGLTNKTKQNSEVKKAEIKGNRLHQSHDEPNDRKPVISVRFKDENDKRLGTGHVHEDGTESVKWK